MTIEVISNSYSGRNRVQNQNAIYEKSDDLYELANLQRRYENIIRQIEQAIEEGKDTERLLEEKVRIEDAMETQQGYVDGYPVPNANQSGENE